MMRRRSTKLAFMGRACGHSFGVLGAVMGLNAIATSIDLHYLQFFPFRDTGIQQASAALLSVGLIALAGWLVADRRQAVKAKIDPPETH